MKNNAHGAPAHDRIGSKKREDQDGCKERRAHQVTLESAKKLSVSGVRKRCREPTTRARNTGHFVKLTRREAELLVRSETPRVGMQLPGCVNHRSRARPKQCPSQ